ncbi:MAG: response regulator [Proteobacteria bacterium]|nr:response regulator [Pseudomonadota bacterium]
MPNRTSVEKTTYGNILVHIIKNPLLRIILMTMLSIAIAFPVFSTYVLFPQIVHLLTTHLKEEAIKNASHLMHTVLNEKAIKTNLPLSLGDQEKMRTFKKDLHLEKIKIFSRSGKTIFSTDSQDIGKVNTHDYYHTLVAKGKIVNHLVRKNSTTLEGRTVSADVIETYMPLMGTSGFEGAIEIYSDITPIKQALSQLLNHLTQTLILFSTAMTIFLFTILIKAGRNMVEKDKADASLQKIHADLEKLVVERTAELVDANHQLAIKVEERKLAQTALKHSHDTQTIVNTLLEASLGESSLQTLLEQCLDLILAMPRLSFESMGSISLVEDDPQVLVMKTHRGFSEDHEKKCRLLSFGNCLCGRAALSKEIVFASHVDDRHDIRLEGAKDHGHYCVPILAKQAVLGVINIYVKSGHQQDPQEEAFLKTIANTLASVLVQRYGEREKEKIRKQLLQSQKVESIGTLAGGIAHDFNNILTGIFGFSLMAKKHINEPEKAKRDIDRTIECAQKAADLVQQILTFSRKSDQKKHPIKLYLVVKDAIKLIRSSIPATIEIQEKITNKSRILADPTQMHQVIMNLCTNAYHAMQKTGGILTICLEEIHVESPDRSRELDILPGTYLKLEVIDTGIGMDSQILDKIFEPYFTTKAPGEGTGLGLAVVHGIVKEHKGYIKITSQPGQGTAIQVFFPVTREETVTQHTDTLDPPPIQGTEGILLADDEDNILGLTQTFLEQQGYRVSSFSNGKTAFEAFEKNPHKFDLVITDMTMPGITGDKLAINILKIRPDLPIVLCTGYSENISHDQAMLLGIRKYVEKPTGLKELAIIIRTILDQEKTITRLDS